MRHRRHAREQFVKQEPFHVVGRPLCTEFSALQALIRGRAGERDRLRRLAEARVLLGFAVEVCWLQLCAGRQYLHEHLAAASSWKEGIVDRLRRDLRGGEVTCHQRRYTLVTSGPGGVPVPPRRPTTFLSSSPLILDRLLYEI